MLRLLLHFIWIEITKKKIKLNRLICSLNKTNILTKLINPSRRFQSHTQKFNIGTQTELETVLQIVNFAKTTVYTRETFHSNGIFRETAHIRKSLNIFTYAHWIFTSIYIIFISLGLFRLAHIYTHTYRQIIAS